ncbi:PTS transporter subunit EIIC [Streptomyces sp. NPDC051322]|uniref:PTS transporter subunit EIIC n=1 Tax=Streptomyces sp. NPDC051322 TaxID=3154645 RepID=UPI00344EF484
MSTSEDKNRATAAAILPLVGGAQNVTSVAHCMTRLRLGLADRSLVQDETLKALPAVMGVVDDETYQIVLGPGTVARVTPEFEALVAEDRAAAPAGPAAASTAAPPSAAAPAAATAEGLADRGAAMRAERKAKNATPVKLFLRKIANIFVPLIPALIGCGIIAGVNGLLVNAGWLTGVTPALAAIASAFMALIAVFVGYNTAKEFGGTPILGGAVAAIIVYPGVANVSAFGEKLSPGQGGVLGALGAAVLAVYVEKWCRRFMPESLDVLLTPALTVLVSGLITLFGLMYVAGEISTAIGDFATWLLAHGGAGAGFILGGLFLPMVMLGLHQALIPIHTTLIEQQGYTVLLPILAMAGAGQVGSAVAVYLRLPHNKSIRKTIRSALPAGFLGVGEPLIYGVSLPIGRPFVTACVGGAFGGGFIGLFNQLGDSMGSTAIGPSGWALFPLLKGDHGLGTSLAIYAGGLLVGYLAGFVATYFFGFSKTLLAEFNVDPAAAATGTAGPAPAPNDDRAPGGPAQEPAGV